jgi:hypothetical protein
VRSGLFIRLCFTDFVTLLCRFYCPVTTCAENINWGLANHLKPALNRVNGSVAEWSKAHAWKVCRRETVSRVRIPVGPPLPLFAGFAKVALGGFFVVYSELLSLQLTG